MNIPLPALRAVTERLFQHLESLGVRSVDLDQDYYWHIDQEELYRPEKDPAKLSMGQLSDDWDELEKIRSGKSPPISYAFVWLAAVLRAMGEKIVK